MASRSSRYEDDDDDDYEPRRRRRFDDDDDDRPRRGPPATAGGGVLIGLAVGGAVLMMVLIGFVFLRSRPAPPAFAPPQGQPLEVGGFDGPMLAPVQPGQAAVRAVLPVRAVSLLSFHTAGTDRGHALLISTGAGAGCKYNVFPLNGPGAGTTGEFNVAQSSGDYATVSPDGRQLAVIASKPFEGNVVHVYTVTTGQSVGAFTPYPRGPQGLDVPELVYVAFLENGDLLTAHRRGGFDVWSVPGFVRKHGHAGFPRDSNQRTDMNGFTRSPNNFALTADGRTLALFNGTGFTAYNTTTGEVVRELEAVMPAKSTVNFSGAAITADGSKLAAVFQNFSDRAGNGPRVVVWDVTTGKKLSDAACRNTPAGMGWWGKDHLVWWEGGNGSAKIVDPTRGTEVGSVRGDGILKIAQYTPGDRLWGLSYDGVQAPTLLGMDAPANLPNGCRVVISANGWRLE